MDVVARRQWCKVGWDLGVGGVSRGRDKQLRVLALCVAQQDEKVVPSV